MLFYQEADMGFYIGIDCGTQGTKVIVYDSLEKKIRGRKSSCMIPWRKKL